MCINVFCCWHCLRNKRQLLFPLFDVDCDVMGKILKEIDFLLVVNIDYFLEFCLDSTAFISDTFLYFMFFENGSFV